MKGDFSRLTFDARTPLPRRPHATGTTAGRRRLERARRSHDAPPGDRGGRLHRRQRRPGAERRWRVRGDRQRRRRRARPSGGGTSTSHPGHCYVAGRLVENDQEVVLGVDALAGSPASGRQRFVAYLDTWSRHITFVEDPGRARRRARRAGHRDPRAERLAGGARPGGATTSIRRRAAPGLGTRRRRAPARVDDGATRRATARGSRTSSTESRSTTPPA